MTGSPRGQSCQAPFRSTGSSPPSRVRPVTATSSPPIMKSMWIALRLIRVDVLVADPDGVAVPERDVARGVLVEERVEEDASRLPDASRAVDERDLAEARRTVVDRRSRPEHLGVLLGVDLDRPAALEPHPEAADDGAGDVERLRGRDDAVDAAGIWGRRDLLRREVRREDDAVDGVHSGPVAGEAGGRQEADREVRARPLEADGVERAASMRRPASCELRQPATPRIRGVSLVEAQHELEVLPQPRRRVLVVVARVDEPRPLGRSATDHVPARRPRVDDLEEVRQVRERIEPGARGVDRRRGRLVEPSALIEIRAQRSSPSWFEPLRVPRRDERERLLRGVLEPRALHERVEVPRVDEPRAARVGAVAIARTSGAAAGAAVRNTI